MVLCNWTSGCCVCEFKCFEKLLTTAYNHADMDVDHGVPEVGNILRRVIALQLAILELQIDVGSYCEC